MDQIFLSVLNREKLMRKPYQTETEISTIPSNFVPATAKRVSTQFERQLPEIIHVNINEKYKIRYKRDIRTGPMWFQTTWNFGPGFILGEPPSI